MVKRYDIDYDWIPEESANGEYVMASDYDSLLAEKELIERKYQRALSLTVCPLDNCPTECGGLVNETTCAKCVDVYITQQVKGEGE